MFLKFIILIAVFYIIYRSVKTWMIKNLEQAGQKVDGRHDSKIDDVMVKDPFCETYFPKRNGIHESINGEDVYFCSTKCRDKYLEQNN